MFFPNKDFFDSERWEMPRQNLANKPVLMGNLLLKSIKIIELRVFFSIFKTQNLPFWWLPAPIFNGKATFRSNLISQKKFQKGQHLSASTLQAACPKNWGVGYRGILQSLVASSSEQITYLQISKSMSDIRKPENKFLKSQVVSKKPIHWSKPPNEHLCANHLQSFGKW